MGFIFLGSESFEDGQSQPRKEEKGALVLGIGQASEDVVSAPYVVQVHEEVAVGQRDQDSDQSLLQLLHTHHQRCNYTYITSTIV